MSTAIQEFMKVMENQDYWDSVIIDKGQEKKDEISLTNDKEDFEVEYLNHYFSNMEEDSKIIEESISSHIQKRDNRKYQASRKFLIKDKKSLYFKALPSPYARNEILNYDTLKTQFYGKPVLRIAKSGKLFCKGKSLSKKDRTYYHDRKTPWYIREKELNKVDFAFDSLNEKNILDRELEQEYYFEDYENDYSNDYSNDLDIVFKEYTEEDMFSVCSLNVDFYSHTDIMDQLEKDYDYDYMDNYDYMDDWD